MGYTQLFASLAHNVETIIVVGGYPFLFLSVLLEGIPLVGTLVPGHVAIIAAGLLIKVGVFNPWITILLSIGGAVLGDYIGYVLGKKYGLSLIDRLRPFFFITDAHIAKTQALLHKHTGKAMVLGRLSPMTRALMPFLVGTNKASESKFWSFNIIGGIIWAVGSIALGYVFGAGYQAAAGYIGKFILVAIALAIIIIWGYKFVNTRFHIFKRYELFVLVLNLISLWVLAQVVQDAWAIHPQLVGFDVLVNTFMSQHVTSQMAHIATWISTIGSNLIIVPIGIIVAIFLTFHKRWRSVSIMLLSLGSAAFFVESMKEFFMRARPENALTVLADPSFPSAHATLAAAFFLIIAYISMPKVHSWIARELVFVGCVVAVIVIGLSRVALSVHWASDVIAGWALGFFCATASILVVRYIGALFQRKIVDAQEEFTIEKIGQANQTK